MIIVWRRPDNTYYYKEVGGYYRPYSIGYRNSYDHEVIVIINNNKCKDSFRKKIIMKTIIFLKKKL